jgi:hypothetical protein
MKLRYVYLKPKRNGAMLRVQRATTTAGLGLDNDCNASAASPRQVLLVSSDSVKRLRLAPQDLRANLIVDLNVDALQSGTVLRFGETRIWLTLACEPCRKLEIVRRGLAREVGGGRGMLGRVITGGELREGAPVVVDDESLPALADRWQARIVDILGHLPSDMNVTFARLAEIAGLQSTYCRAFPALLRRLGQASLPLDRVVMSNTAKPIGSRRPKSDQVPHLWDGTSYYARSEAVVTE